MKNNLKSMKFLYMLFIILSFGILVQTPLIDNTSAAIYTLNMVSTGDSVFTVYLDLDTTAWTRGTTYSFDIGLTVNAFGPGIDEFFNIILWLEFLSGLWDYYDTADWGIVDTEGGSYENTFYYVPDESTPDTFSLSIGAEFFETGYLLTDEWNNYVLDIVVSDPAPPLITHPIDITYEEGDTGNEISWTATHDSPDVYSIYQGITLVQTDSWSSGIPIIYSVDYLLKGDYEYTLYVWDTNGKSNNDSVNVHVVDNSSPTINSPVDISFEEYTTGLYIEWIAYDSYPASYELKRNGADIDAGIWEASTQLRFSLDNLEPGTHLYCLTVTDESDNSTSDCVEVEVVQVVDNSSPTISSPIDITFEENSTGLYIEWIAYDSYPASYELKRNGAVIDAGIWEASTQLRFSLDNLEPGTHLYCLTVTDKKYNSAIDCVEVEVIGTAKSGKNSILATIISVVTLLSIASIFKRKINKVIG